MKLLFCLLFLTICLIGQVLSQNFFNFVGSYNSNDCSGKSFGIGYVFTNNFCSGSINENWLFNITDSGEEGEVTLYAEGGGCGGWFQPDGPPTVYYNNQCSAQLQFSNESVSTTQYSMIQISDNPIYEKNSVVFQYYNDDYCLVITNSQTYSNGLTVTLADQSTVKYTCVSGEPYLEYCNGSQCTNKAASISCEYKTRVFCSN